MNSNIKDIYSLTPSQEGIYAQYYQRNETKTYQLQNLSKISKSADLEKLSKSVELLSLRHPVLKSAFTVLKTGAIKQVILENRKPEFTVIEKEESFTQEGLNKIISDNIPDSLDLQKDSLFRVTIIDFNDTRFMVMHSHHIIIDGWCLPVIISDLQRYYGKLISGTTTEELTKEIEKEVSSQTSYAQYANWVKKQNTEEVTRYWENLLADSEISHIYGKEKKENIKNEDIVTFTTPLDSELSQQIEQFAKTSKVSANTVFECAFGITLQKYSGSEDIIYDKVISGRSVPLKNIENTVGLFVNTVPMRIQANENSTLADLLKKTHNQTLNANKNGIVPLSEIYKTSGIDNKSVDALFVFENYFIGDSSDIENGPLAPQVISFDEQTEFNLTVMIMKDNKDYSIRTSYAKEMYTEREIRSFLNGYISILNSSLNEETLIKDITAISEEERETILKDFNDTEYTYDIPNNTTLYSLFNEQAEKNEDKVCIIANDEEITYRDFKAYAERIDSKVRNITNSEKSVIAVICERSFEMYGAVYGIIRGGNAYLPIDPNYPQDRIDYILSNSNAKAVVAQDKFCHLAGNTPCINATEVLNNKEITEKTEILANENDTAYVIYTSGSTGNPKGAKISHKSAINRILWMDDFYPLNENDVILQKTPYTFDVSVWELFWWGITGRTLCASKPDEHFLPAKILDETNNHKVTHLHFVPSVFDLFLTHLENNPEEQSKFNTVKYVFLSGEALTANSINRFYNIYDYNKVSLHNLYGPTECAVDVSYYPCVPTDVDPVPIGKPIYNTQLHIVDKYLNPTPIGVTGELCIAGVNVGQGYLNNETLTNEKFIDNPFGTGKLYKTGDLAYWREDGQICYVGRNDFQVKINGQRIELGEIENAIGAIDGVVQCAVIVKEQYICAYYTGTEKEVKELRTNLGTTLPRYMVPHVFTYMESLPMTVSGKLDRKALPEIDFNSISAENEYLAPQTEMEILLTKAIETVLETEKVSIIDNFFDLGGDSLKAIELISEIEDKGYTVNVKSIFEAKDIQSLAKELLVKEEKSEQIEYSSILPATAAQMRVYTSQMMNPEVTHYNIKYVFKTENLDCEKLEKSINQLIARHESLRTHFETVNGTICQVIDEKATIKVDELSEEEILCFTKSFDLNKSPLMYAGCNKDTIAIVFHHIIADGESMPVIFKELNELYMGRELPETVQYGEFAVTDTHTEEDEKYWLDVFNEETTELNLPTDYPRPEKQSFNGANLYSQISNELNEKIQDKCKQLGITPYAYYMACYNILLSKYSGNEDICVGTPMSGRNSKFLDTVGMFVNTVVLRTNTEGNKTVNELMQEIRENSVSAISHQSFPFGELVKKLNISSTNRNPLFDVVFAYQGEEMTNILLGDEKSEIIPVNTKSVKNELAFYLFPRKEDVALSVEYNTDLFKEATVKRFIESYKDILTQALNEKTRIKDISVLSEEENRKLLKDCNDTTVEYPRDKCVLTLFEETVKVNPYAKAVVAQDKTLAYGELDEESNKLANSLIEKGVGKGDIVGIKLGRTSKFLVSLLGILKTGAAYLPLDHDHPQDRINTILEDSSAKLCITEENFNELIDKSDMEKPDIKISGDDLCYCIYTSGSTGTPKGAMIQHKNICWYMYALMSIYGTEPINMPFFTSPAVDLSVPSYLLPLVTGGTTYFYDNDLLVDLADIVNNEEINTIKVTPTHLQIMLQHIEGRNLRNMKYLISGGESLRQADCVEFLEKFGEHIEIHNEYGPTEATVSCVDYQFSRDDIDDIVSIGAPIDNAQIYIVDKYMNLLPLGVTGELCIAGDGVCAGYLNNLKLTEEKFVDNPFGEGKLYKTGDLAFWREDGNLTFVGRNDFQVKIRGLRIEIGEIENAVSSVDGVVQCAVVVRTDANDRRFICAFYTGAETKSIDFRAILGTKLPKYMIPHIFTHLDEMPLTSSGKISRNSLPEIDLESVSTETEYVASETDEEKALAGAIKVVLNAEKVSMLDNFFNIGGDSITAIYLVSELEDMGYKLQVSDIMQSDTLQDIAKSIRTKAKKEEVDEYKDNLSAMGDYDQNEVIGIVPFSPIMRAFLKKSNGLILNDFIHTSIISVDCNEETVKKALDIIVSHHDILRGRFAENGIEILPSDKYKAYSFASINIADKDEAIRQLLNIELDDKLVKAVLCYTNEECLLSITVHHFLIDLVSWEVLMKDFNTIVKQLNNNEKARLSDKTASFKLWNEELATYSDTISQENKAYWDNVNEELTKSKSFNTNEEINEAEEYQFTLSNDIVDKLINKVNKTYDTRPNETLLTALGLAAGRLAEDSVGIIVESHGRTELHKPIAIEKTIGWFTSCYPVVIRNNENIVEELLRVKETMRSTPKNGVEYLLLNNGFHNNANIKFNYYKNSISNENRDNKLVEFNGNNSVFPDMINVSCSITEDNLSVLITVPKCMHKKDISKELGKEFVKQIEKIIECTDILPATAAQMRIYTAQVMSSEPTLYNLSSAFKMDNFDADRFENAINKLIARHEGLRTSFQNRNGQIFQVINENVSVKLEKLESTDLSTFIKPFDLTKAPLMRVGYIGNTVIIDMHHIVSDGSTFGILYKEINELYMGRELPEAVQYREFAVSDTYTKDDEDYWLKEFEELPDFELYTDFLKQDAKGDKGRNLYTKIDQNLHENILIKCKEWGVTPYAYYMACVSILLSKYSGSEDVCVGVTSNGRSSKFLNTWGMFVNMLSIRTKPEGERTFKDFALEIKNKSFNAIAHQSYPQQELLKKLNIKKPIYDVMFIYQSEKMTHSVIGDKKAELIPVTISTSRAPLMFYISPREEDTLLRTEYLTDLFKAETIDKFIASYMSILTQALDEKALIKDIFVLSEEEKVQINSFNETEHTYNIEENTTLYTLFEEQSTKNEDKVCIKANDEEITYRDFKAYVERLDSKVRNITNSEKSVIAVICERSFEMYGAVYGIIRGGNAYLPIDPNYPQDRIDYILSNSNAKAVIAQDKFCHLAGNTICINATEVLNSTEQPEKTECLANENDTAYVIYTSGSTGNPKGAKISHKSAINRILWMDDFYPLNENDVILQKTPYTFDVSVWELFWWGITGRTLCASKPDEHFLPAKILNETEKNKVTHLHFVPSVFDLFLTYLENNPEEQSKFKTVKYVFLSGEALTANSINRFYKMYDYNKVSLHNLYGPTECAVDVSYYPCVPTDVDPVPIGKPIYNTQLHIVDKYLNPTPIGVTGELCIAGVNVGQGYLNNEELTNEKFIDNPFGTGKLYKTGDLAYWRNDGQICYVGRIDNQIKLNGQRVELGEIEKVIGEVFGVESVAVIIKQKNGKDTIVAFYCGDENSTNEIIKHCENKLPQYMVPGKIQFIEQMPLNQSGKLDRKTLKNIDVVFDNVAIREEPVTKTEKQICELFQETLNIDFVGRNENFFNLGGTSLDMISILSEALLKNISAASFIANPTPEKLANIIEVGMIEDGNDFYTLKNVPNSTKALLFVPYAAGDASAFAAITNDFERLAPDMSLYYVDYLHSQEECIDVAQKIAKLAKAKDISIYAHCAGAAVALQIINILEKQGVNISNYINGGFVPPEKAAEKNGWNRIPNFLIQRKIVKAGAPIGKLPADRKKEFVVEFRKDTDFMTEYFYKNATPINAKTSVIISKTDIFTKNYQDAERLWRLRAPNFDKVHYIDADSHYFQTDNSKEVAQIILNTISQ